MILKTSVKVPLSQVNLSDKKDFEMKIWPIKQLLVFPKFLVQCWVIEFHLVEREQN